MSAHGDSFSTLLKKVEALQQRGAASLSALRELGPVEVGLTPRNCIYAEDKIRLYRYAPSARPAKAAPLLICYAMVNRPYMLDLQPDRSLIRELLSAGLDVYLIDWGYPDGADRFKPLADYICGYLDRCVDHVLKVSATAAVNLLGVCQGGTLSLCYAALEPRKIAALITMVTPVDFKTPENLLSKWAQHIDVEKLTRSGNVTGDFLNTVFLALMPFRLTQQKYVNLLQMKGDRAQYEYFMRMEKWIFDSPDQPARAFREFIEWFFQQNRLVRGALSLDQRPVLLANVTQPLLNVYATKDHLVPPSATLPLGAHVGSTVYDVMPVAVGHIGMYVSGSARIKVPTAIAEWLVERHAAARRSST